MPDRIAIISHTPPSVTRGGAEISAYTLYAGLKQLGLPAVFISACPIDSVHKVLPASEDEYVVPYDPGSYDRFYHVASPDVVEAVEKLVQQLDCQTLFFHHFLHLGVNTIRRMAELGREVVLTLHEFVALCFHHGQMVTRPQFRLCRQSHPALCVQCFPDFAPDQFGARKVSILDSLADVAALVSPSHFLAERCKAWGFRADRFVIIENGLIGIGRDEAADMDERDLAASARFVVEEGARHHGGSSANGAERRPHLELDGQEDNPRIIIGFFGQLNPFKGLDVILDAAARLADDTSEGSRYQFRVHGNVVGLDERLSSRFEEAVAAGLIDYRGVYDNNDVFNLMKGCDYILMASRWWENSPVVIQEAFWVKRPLIVPGIGGMAEKVQDGVNGFHFRPGDGADLARVCRVAAGFDRSRFSFPTPSSAEQMARQYLRIIGRDLPAITAGAENAAGVVHAQEA